MPTKLYTMAEAARMCGKRADTLYRWRTTGIRGIKLECVYVGGSPRVAQSSLDEFFRQVTAERCKPSESHET